ncbi:hypothetical protein IFR05_013519 [Cadophora sp. M221]|nr:hypothetical protein IFR05_013519 [Cadophora sp. M221]
MSSNTGGTRRGRNLKIREEERLNTEQMAASSSQNYDYPKDEDDNDISTDPAIPTPLSIAVPQWRPTFPAGPSRREVSETFPLNNKSAATDGLSWAQVACLKPLDGEPSFRSMRYTNENLKLATVLLTPFIATGGTQLHPHLDLNTENPVVLEGGRTPIPEFFNSESSRDAFSEAGDLDFCEFFGNSESQTLAPSPPSQHPILIPSQQQALWAQSQQQASPYAPPSQHPYQHIQMPGSQYYAPPVAIQSQPQISYLLIRPMTIGDLWSLKWTPKRNTKEDFSSESQTYSCEGLVAPQWLQIH